jgi:hypothetical protein
MDLPEPNISFREIADADIAPAVTLLARGFPRQGRETWLRALQHLGNHQSPRGLPKYGYLMECHGRAVGLILTIFATVRSGDTQIVRCNPCAWYVEKPYRAFAGLLFAKALMHEDVTYLDISPAPDVEPIIEALGFSRYCNGSFVAVPLFNILSGEAGVRILDARQQPSIKRDASDQDLLLAHADQDCISLWCETSDGAYPFVFRRRLARGFLPCAHLIYCRGVEDFVRFAGPLGRRLAMRGSFFVVIGSNGPVPGLVGTFLPGILPRYFKGPMQPGIGDIAFTEFGVLGI